MRMRRGTFTSMVLVLTTALVLSGCTAGGDAVVRLTFWNGFTGPDRPVLEELVETFNRTHPGVRVEMNVMPWDVLFQKMPAAYNAGRGPDLAAFETVRIAMYASRGFLGAVDDWYTAASAALHQHAAEATRYDGKRYGLPFTFTPTLLFYNRKLFREAGLDPDRPPTTWPEWQDHALRLTKFTEGSDTPSQFGLAIPDHQSVQIWPILLWGNGGDILSADGRRPAVDDPATVEAVRTWADLIATRKVSPIGLSGPEADKLFETGKAAMEIVGPWMTAGFTKAGVDYGVAMVPAGPKRQVTMAASTTLALSATADATTRRAAGEFFAFWTSPETQQRWSAGTGFPTVRTDVKPQNAQAAVFDRHAGAAVVLLPGVPEYQKIYTEILEPAIQRVEHGEASAEEAMSRAAEQIRPLLAR
ncbi:ABC transporter substrate-binding protein [Actinosynnema sp. CS-041913]|uniref:ABC transporter substrate-binding protein n=1 Tax=Actinosynnema sp. CS-041913 TaxID=3239917 RepID=UPI003D94B127